MQKNWTVQWNACFDGVKITHVVGFIVPRVWPYQKATVIVGFMLIEKYKLIKLLFPTKRLQSN